MTTKRPALYVGQTEYFTLCDQRFSVTLEADQDHGAPWDECDGHGEVSTWEIRDKAPGELILSEDGRVKRFYDFAGACRLARRDGWGFLPGDLETFQNDSGQWVARVAARYRQPAQFECVADDINAAIRAVYAAHRATFPSARAYAAAAAMSDYNRLRDWCRDEWEYVGVIVTAVSDDEEAESMPASLWGIESDCAAYLWEVVEELAAETLAPQCRVA